MFAFATVAGPRPRTFIAVQHYDMRKNRNLLTAAIFAVLLGGAFMVSFSPASVSVQGLSTSRRFGFGFVHGATIASYGPSTFFQAMFLTPPYPSTVQITLNNGIQDINNFGSVVHQLMALAAPYPNIKIGIDVAFDVSSASQWATFTNWLQGMASDPNSGSIGYIGFAAEQLNEVTTSKNSTWESHAFEMFQSRISSTPFQFISYYPQGIPGGASSGWAASYLFMYHTNYPASDPQGYINGGVGQSNIVGITHGLDGWQVFPSVGCSKLGYPNNYAQPGWSTVSFPQGYLPPGFTGPPPDLQPCNNAATGNGFSPTIDQVLSADNSNPLANRQWDNFVAGNAGTDYSAGQVVAADFIGVSGRTTHLLWDSPTFREKMARWLANNPNTFLTSNGTSPPPVTSTTTSSSFTGTTTTQSSTTTTIITSFTDNTTAQSSTTTTIITSTTKETAASSSHSTSSGNTADVATQYLAAAAIAALIVASLTLTDRGRKLIRFGRNS